MNKPDVPRRATRPQRSALLSASLALLAPSVALAQASRGTFTYASAQQCVSDRKLTSEYCANAAANASAEFDEKAPRFPSRAACERVHGAGHCSLGFGGDAKARGVFFSPRMQSFSVKVSSERDITVVPVVGSISVSPRSVLRRDTHINPAVAVQARHNLQPAAAPRPGFAGGREAVFGAAHPEGPGGPLPPRAPLDPNFDCASVLEPSAAASADTGCYPARRMQSQ